MSSENGIDYAKEIWLGQADDYEGNPEDIEGNGSVLWSQANNFEANGQRYVRADIHEALRNRVAKLEAEFLEWLRDREKTLIELIGKSHPFSATFVSELEDLRPIIDKSYELLQPSTPDPKGTDNE